MSYIHFPDLVLHTVGRLAKYPQHCLWCVKSDEIDENVTHSLQISFHRSVQAHTISFVSYFLFLSAYRPPSARNMHLIAPGSKPNNNKKKHSKILRRMMMAMASGFFSTLHNLKPNSLQQQSARLHPHLFDAVTWKPPSTHPKDPKRYNHCSLDYLISLLSTSCASHLLEPFFPS